MPMDEFKKIAVQTALKGGEILNEHRGKVKHIGYKGEVNLVTEVDRISEETILKIIKKNFPDHAILTEESKEFIPEGKKSKSTYKWIIDPLDGTTNYAHDFPMYCVSVALEKDGEIILGVVYNPNLDELFVAEKGNGAIFSEGFRGHKFKRKISV